LAGLIPLKGLAGLIPAKVCPDRLVKDAEAGWNSCGSTRNRCSEFQIKIFSEGDILI